MEMKKNAIPDTTISIKDMHQYGYIWEGMLPLRKRAAIQFFKEQNKPLYRLYEDNTEGQVESMENLLQHANNGGIFGVEKEK